ncbi:MAG TPA: arginase family protein [Candidatus Acidoferrum sp.]|nr:arginase family protein [Candidatus Acidoferrum sp.]
MRPRIGVIGAPLCDGVRDSGVENAPRALRHAGLVEILKTHAEVRDCGDLSLETVAQDELTGKSRNLKLVADGCRSIKRLVSQVVKDGYFPLVIGGDCSLFPGALAGITSIDHDISAIYLDGHPDFHTPETTKSGYFSGMSLAIASGFGPDELTHLGDNFPIVKPQNVLLAGPRPANIDQPEIDDLIRAGVRNIFLKDQGAEDFELELTRSSQFLPRPVYLHFDCDVMNPQEMPALAGMKANVHCPGGLRLDEALSVCNVLSTLPLVGMDVTLYDPTADNDGKCAKKIIKLVEKVLFP